MRSNGDAVSCIVHCTQRPVMPPVSLYAGSSGCGRGWRRQGRKLKNDLFCHTRTRTVDASARRMLVPIREAPWDELALSLPAGSCSDRSRSQCSCGVQYPGTETLPTTDDPRLMSIGRSASWPTRNNPTPLVAVRSPYNWWCKLNWTIDD